LSAIDELAATFSGNSRVLVVSEREVDLHSLAGENHLYLLKLIEGSLAAGGRGGGLGERRIVSVTHYVYRNGACEKVFQTEEESLVAKFEVPYHVARMPMKMRDGAEQVGYGVIDPDVVKVYLKAEGASAP